MKYIFIPCAALLNILKSWTHLINIHTCVVVVQDDINKKQKSATAKVLLLHKLYTLHCGRDENRFNSFDIKKEEVKELPKYIYKYVVWYSKHTMLPKVM